MQQLEKRQIFNSMETAALGRVQRVADEWNFEEIGMICEIGYQLATQGCVDEAMRIFAGLVEIAPTTAYFQATLGALRLRVDQPQLAVTNLQAALRLNPADAATLLNLGEAHLQLGNDALAEKFLQAALAGEKSNAADQAALSGCRKRARGLLDHLENSKKPRSDQKLITTAI